MKQKINSIKIILVMTVLIFITSCQKKEFSEEIQKNNGEVEFGLNIDNSKLNNKEAGNSIDFIYSAIVTIENEFGEIIYDTQELTIYKFGDTYVSEPLSLKVGTYMLTEFMLADEANTVLYAAPVESSTLAHLVNDPLPIEFIISKDIVLKIVPEVLSVEDNTPEDFGYTTFGFDIVDIFDFLLGVFVFDESTGNFELTDANLLVIGDSYDTLYHDDLSAVTNQVTLNSGYSDYNLTITKNGYNTYQNSFSEDSLSQHYSTAGPLTIILSTGSTNSLVLQPGPDEGIDAFIEQWPLNNYSNRNFGTHPEFQASAWTAQGIPCTVRNLINFDLTSIPAGSAVTNAKLYLYSVSNTVNGPGHSTLSGPNECVIQRVTDSWDELTVSWNTQPTTTTENQVYVETSNYYLQDYEINVTDLIQDIIDNPSSDYGLMLRLLNETYYRRMLFASSDYDVAEKRPKIVIEFE